MGKLTDNKNKTVVNVEYNVTADKTQLKKILSDISGDIAKSLSNSLVSSVEKFGQGFAKGVTAIFKDGGKDLKALSTPIRIELDIIPAQQKLTQLAKQLSNIKAQIPNIDNINKPQNKSKDKPSLSNTQIENNENSAAALEIVLLSLEKTFKKLGKEGEANLVKIQKELNKLQNTDLQSNSAEKLLKDIQINTDAAVRSINVIEKNDLMVLLRSIRTMIEFVLKNLSFFYSV